MLVAERTLLSEVLEDWLERQRVSVAHVVKHSGVSRNTIWLIQQGTTTAPEIQTLRKISRALATAPKDGTFNQAEYSEALRDLSAAAGVDPEADAIPAPTLESMIRSEGVKSPRQAAKLAAFLRKYPNMNPNERRLVDALIDNLGE